MHECKECRGVGVHAPWCYHNRERTFLQPGVSLDENKGAGPASGRVVRDVPAVAQGQHAINTAVSNTAPPEPVEPILQFFGYTNLPTAMQDYSRPFYDLAHWMVDNLPRNAERTVALRKILEAKDCAVRAFIARK